MSAPVETVPHVTECADNEWSRAGMLRQVALLRDYGEIITTAVYLLSCPGCDWHESATTHAEQLDKRLAHELENRT